MNKISPKSLLHSKWTKVNVENKERHFIITKVKFDEDQRIINCITEALMTHQEYEINWRDLKDSQHWKMGWQ